MSNIKFNLALILAVLFSVQGYSQSKLTLEEVVMLAKNQSSAAKRAETRKENRFWQYRTFRSNYVPQLQLNGTVPTFTRAVRRVQQNDGSFQYFFLNQNTAELELSLTQSIAATGGQVFISSSVERFDDFEGGGYIYGGDPVSVGFLQPLFGFNPLKWDKKIEPLRYEESRRQYVEEMEQLSQQSAQLFFDLLTSQISLDIANLNVNSNDTIYKIALGRYQLGKIPENDLLQLELNLMNSRQSVAQAELNLETTSLRLRSFLGLGENQNVELVVPSLLPDFPVDETVAIEMANKNRSDAIAFNRRKLEANRDVAQAVGTSGLNANLFGRFGLSNQSTLDGQFSEIYSDPNNQLIANVGFSIPVIDWGRQKARKKTAEANQQLIEFTVQQDEVNFEEEILTQVRTFMMLRSQVAISAKADEISQKRYEISKNRYLIGKISITDLSLAITEKDRAKQDYLSSLGNFWAAYYQLRSLTLYDFKSNQQLYNPEIESIRN